MRCCGCRRWRYSRCLQRGNCGRFGTRRSGCENDLRLLLADVIAGGTGGSSGVGPTACKGRTIFAPKRGEMFLLIDELVEEERLDLLSIDETPPGTGVICARATELKASRPQIATTSSFHAESSVKNILLAFQIIRGEAGRSTTTICIGQANLNA